MKESDRKKYEKPARRSAIQSTRALGSRLAMTLAILMLTIIAPPSKARAENVVDLSTYNSIIYTAKDGYVLTDESQSKLTKIEIDQGATVTLRDATIKCTVECQGDATIILEGNNTVTKGILVKNIYTLTINGTGSLNVTGSGNCAAIGGNETYNSGNIIINGGNITAQGGARAAGIGGGKNTGYGDITINGGTVNATGGQYAAGIGTGVVKGRDVQQSSKIKITINGGTVTATGGEGAAGIGNGLSDGYTCRCGYITITGGIVNATGGDKAAGIGCGKKQDDNNKNNECQGIDITGGIVTATGGNYAADIGAGYSTVKIRNLCLYVTISGGITRVEAKTIGRNSNYGKCNHVNIASGLLKVGDTHYGPSEATFAKEGFGTYYNSQTDATLPAGMKAMIVTAKGDGGTLTYETIADGSLTDAATAIVPASTAVMLQVAPSTDAQTVGGITLASPSAAAITQTNLLKGAEDPNGTTTTGSGLHYKLSYNTSGSDLGWYWGVDGGAFTSAAHKAWLVLPSTAGTRGFFGLPGDDETTLLRKVNSEEVNSEEWFSLDGRRLNGRPSAKGLYIHNGSKVAIK